MKDARRELADSLQIPYPPVHWLSMKILIVALDLESVGASKFRLQFIATHGKDGRNITGLMPLGLLTKGKFVCSSSKLGSLTRWSADNS